jgi:proteic killer suppression protein
MILTFGNRLAKDLVEENPGGELRAFPADLKRAARKKLAMLHAAKELRDLLSPHGNRLERLKGERRNEYSLRINDQWRVVFRFAGGNAEEVRVEDYH